MKETVYSSAEAMRKGQNDKRAKKQEHPISKVYPVIDNDLARDNLENDLPEADKENL